jgi:hypothetical protein
MRIARAESALMGRSTHSTGNPFFVEEAGRLVEVGIVEQLEAEIARLCSLALFQDNAVMRSSMARR